MLRIWPEQLHTQLREGLRCCYILSGNEPLLLQESQDAIRQIARQQAFTEHITITLDNQSDWEAIFTLCQSMSLFASRRTLLLMLPENGPSAAMSEQLLALSKWLHDDILLILRSNKLTKAQENAAWFKALGNNAVMVSCQTPEQAHLPRWLARRAESMQLELDNAASQLLCYYYEGNLLALSQTLERLSLLYPDKKLTLPRVEVAVNDVAHFTPFHWVDALLNGKNKRALHILQQLAAEGCEPVILLRTIQRDLILLLTLQRQGDKTSLRQRFDQHRIWQNRRPLFISALERLNTGVLQQALRLLVQMELKLKQDYSQMIWSDLERFSLLLCNKPFPEGVGDD